MPFESATGPRRGPTCRPGACAPRLDRQPCELVCVRQGKYFELDLATSQPAEARALASEVADKLLANPVIESYRVEVDGLDPVPAEERRKVTS